MTIRTVLLAAAFASAAVLSAAAEPAAPSDDEDCDDIMTELQELSEQVTKDRASAKSPLAVCAATGQILGVVKASREVASECFEAGKKRDDFLARFERTVKELEGQIGSRCK